MKAKVKFPVQGHIDWALESSIIQTWNGMIWTIRTKIINDYVFFFTFPVTLTFDLIVSGDRGHCIVEVYQVSSKSIILNKVIALWKNLILTFMTSFFENFDVIYDVIVTSSDVVRPKQLYIWNRLTKTFDLINFSTWLNEVWNFRNLWPCTALIKVKVKGKGQRHNWSSLGHATIWT